MCRSIDKFLDANGNGNEECLEIIRLTVVVAEVLYIVRGRSKQTPLIVSHHLID